MALIPGLSTSLSGMKTAQAQLDIVSRNIANVDRFNVFPVNLGSNMLPNITCNAINPAAVSNGCCNDGAVTNEYNIGNAHATMAPIVGI